MYCPHWSASRAFDRFDASCYWAQHVEWRNWSRLHFCRWHHERTETNVSRGRANYCLLAFRRVRYVTQNKGSVVKSYSNDLAYSVTFCFIWFLVFSFLLWKKRLSSGTSQTHTLVFALARVQKTCLTPAILWTCVKTGQTLFFHVSNDRWVVIARK